MEEQEINIKPCPLCAAPAQESRDGEAFIIFCMGCNLRCTNNKHELLIKVWNQRKKPAVQKEKNMIHKSLHEKEIFSFPNDDTLMKDTESILDPALQNDHNLYFRISRFLWGKMKETYGDTNKHLTTARANDWIDSIRLMVEADKIHIEGIKAAAKWLYESNDTFWRYTVKSVTGFRKNIASISGSMNKQKAGIKIKPNLNETFFQE